jgi:simple sugar transport system permease protein
VAINLLGLGAGAYLAVRTFSNLPGGGPTQSPPLPQLPFISIPGLSDWLGQIEETGIWLVSDIAGVLRALTTNLNVLSIIAVLLLILSWWILWHTPFGLRLRSCGEAPQAAETLGVNVIRYKFMAVLISGGLAGPGRRLPRPGRLEPLPRGQTPAEGTSASRDDLRQLADRRPRRRRRAVRLHRRDPAARRRRRRRGPTCCRSPSSLSRGAVWILVRRRQGKPLVGVVTVILGILSAVWFLGVTPRVQRVHRHDALRRHVAGPRLRLATAATTGRRRAGLPEG